MSHLLQHSLTKGVGNILLAYCNMFCVVTLQIIPLIAHTTVVQEDSCVFGLVIFERNLGLESF